MRSLKASDKQVKIIVIVVLLALIALMLVYPELTGQESTSTQQQVTSNQTTTSTIQATSSTGTSTVAPSTLEYNLSFYVKVLKDAKIGKIYYKGVPPFYSILLHGQISNNTISYLGVIYDYKMFSLGELARNPRVQVGDKVFEYYEPEKTPKGCDTYGFKVSSTSSESYSGFTISYCSYLYTSSNQVYIAGNATSNGLAGVVFLNWKQDKVFILLSQRKPKQLLVKGDWFLQLTYKREYGIKEPLAVRILLVNARPESLVDIYYNRDSRFYGVSLAFANNTLITPVQYGKIYLRRKLVYSEAVYDYTWYPTLAGLKSAYFPPGEYLLHVNYTLRVRVGNELVNTSITYNDKVSVVSQDQTSTETITGILVVGGYNIVSMWTKNNGENTLNTTIIGPSSGQIPVELHVVFTNGTVKVVHREVVINNSIVFSVNGEVKSIIVKGRLPSNRDFVLTLPLKQ